MFPKNPKPIRREIPRGIIESIVFYVKGTEDNKHAGYIEIKDKSSNDSNGIQDLHMGTTSRHKICTTCGNNKLNCHGHPGYINLSYPVKSPMYLERLTKWLKVICHKCGHPIIDTSSFSDAANKAEGNKCRTPGCNFTQPHVIKGKKSTDTNIYITETGSNNRKVQRAMFNHEIFEILSRVSDETVKRFKAQSHPSKMILYTINAVANTVRPDEFVAVGGRSTQNHTTKALSSIMSKNISLPKVIPDMKQLSQNAKLKQDYADLERAVYDMIRGASASAVKQNAGGRQLKSLANDQGSKKGTYRQNGLGRKTFVVGRAVITGDPALKIDEIGIPESAASTFSIPETVQPWNIDRLNTYFNNKQNRYPGCSHVIMYKNNRQYDVTTPAFQKYKLQYGDTLIRNLIDGDWVNFNRQPSALNSSVSGFCVKILKKGNTFRMNPSACNAFNADFDGDQMNILLPKSIAAVNEVQMISNVSNWFISHKTQTPIVGSFQDGLIGLFKFSHHEHKMDKFHAMQLCSNSIGDFRFKKAPDKTYTSHEIISMMLPDINILDRKPGMYKKEFTQYIDYSPEDTSLVISRGKHISGVLDKKFAGQGSNGSIYHIIYNEYGAKKALDVIYSIQQCTNEFMYNSGFTVGLDDIKMSDKSLIEMNHKVSKLIADAVEVNNRLVQRQLYPPIGVSLREHHEDLVVKALNPGSELADSIMENVGNYRENGILSLVLSGSKGKIQNLFSILGILGQQTIEGFRPPRSFAMERTSPYFPKSDLDPLAHGYVPQSFKRGISPKSFLFTSMESRISLINVALSTAKGGEQNRNAIKALESIIVHSGYYTQKHRSISQILYAGTGVDPRFAESVKYPTIKLSNKEFEDKYHVNIKTLDRKQQTPEIKKILDSEFEKIAIDRENYRNAMINDEQVNIINSDLSDSGKQPINVHRIMTDVIHNNGSENYKISDLDIKSAVSAIDKFCNNFSYVFMNDVQESIGAPRPEFYDRSLTLFKILIRSHLCVANMIKPGKVITNDMLQIILDKIRKKFQLALIEYGSSVGIFAAECLTEPLVQAALDSKHRAGANSGSKTSAINKAIELFTIKPTEKMANPYMVLRVLSEYETNQVRVQEIANQIEMLKFGSFIISEAIIFEEFGNPVGKYSEEKSIYVDFFETTPNAQVPKNMSKFCIRFELNKEEMLIKNLTLYTFINVIIEKYGKDLVPIYNSELSDNLIVRCHIRNSFFSDRKQTAHEDVNALMHQITSDIIRGVNGVYNAYTIDTKISEITDDGRIESKTIYFIQTDGSNLADAIEHPMLDPTKCYCDSVMEMYEIFGIETARDKLRDEIFTVMKNDSRAHTTVFADEMTVTGMPTPINESGLKAREKHDILLRASFRNSTKIITAGALDGSRNPVHSTSSSLLLGQPMKFGTHFPTICINQQFIMENAKNFEQLVETL